MQIEEINIPLSRVAVLIGEKGRTKRKFEKLTNTKLDIDSKTGNIRITAEKKSITFYNGLSIIRAIARGFSPENAMVLLDDSFVLDIIEINDYAKTPKNQKIKRARIIGTKGSFRIWLEKNIDVKISVQGKTISIIGKYESTKIARDAIELLLSGAEHSSAYNLVKKRLGQPEYNL